MLRIPIFGARPFDEIILHVGLHKTASTSIQRVCAANRIHLRKQGVHYPAFKIAERPEPESNHSYLFGSLFCDNPDDYQFNKLRNINGVEANRSYAKQLARVCRSKYDRLLISGEDISLIKSPQLAKLADYMQKFTKRLRVLAFVRHPLEWCESATQEHVKTGGDLSWIQPPGQLKIRIERLAEIFGDRLELESFETARSCRFGPDGYFFDRIGIDHRRLVEVNVSASNEGISAEAVRLMSLIHRKYRQSSFHARTDGLRNNPVVSLPGARFRLHEEEVGPLCDELVEVIHWLNGRFGFTYAVPDMGADRMLDEWNASTVEALDDILSRTRERDVRQAAVECLNSAASRICGIDRAKADDLRVLSSNIAKGLPPGDVDRKA